MKSPRIIFSKIFSNEPLTFKYYSIISIFIALVLLLFFTIGFWHDLTWSFFRDVDLFIISSIFFYFVLIMGFGFLMLIYPIILIKRLETLKLRWVWMVFLIGGSILVFMNGEYGLNISDYVFIALFNIPAFIGFIPDRFRQHKMDLPQNKD